MERPYMTKRWAAVEKVVILTFVLMVFVLLFSEEGSRQFFDVINSYYGILLFFLVIIYYRKGWWSLVPLWIVTTASLARGVFHNPDVVEVFMTEGSLHTVFLFSAAVVVVDIYFILHTPQITVTESHLVLDFGRTVFNWQNISEIRVDERHVEVEKKEKRFFSVHESTRSIADVSGLITTLSQHCHEMDIPFSQC